MKTLKLAILGYGNAGRAYGKLLTEKADEIKEKYDTQALVTAIAGRSKGTLIDTAGIDLGKAESDIAGFGKFQGATAMSAVDVARVTDYDVLIELTALDIFSGQPAIDHIKAAFQRKKHVISANKGPLAWAFRELRTMADEAGSLFFYETTVMDGTPVFNLTEHALKLCRVTEIRGILNSTTNFVLEEMEKGVPYDDIMREGKRRGFVEADPSLDISGWDAAAKVTALMNVLMDAGITPPEIDREGIETITPDKIKNAGKRGKVIKLLCGGKIENGKAMGYVRPEEIDKNSGFASITGTSSAVAITTDLMGTISIVEHDPEIGQTAYGILSDTLRIIERT